MMYNKTVQDYFFSPQHVGLIDLSSDLTVVFANTQKDQGTIEFYMQCTQDGIIQRVCFKTNGNPYLIAGLEWLCRQVEGLPLDKAPQIDYQELINDLNIPVSQYPLALRIVGIYKETLSLMNKRMNDERSNAARSE